LQGACLPECGSAKPFEGGIVKGKLTFFEEEIIRTDILLVNGFFFGHLPINDPGTEDFSRT